MAKGNGSGNGDDYHVDDATALLTTRSVDDLTAALRATTHQNVALQRTCSDLAYTQQQALSLASEQLAATRLLVAAVDRLSIMLREVTTIEIDREAGTSAVGHA